MDGEKYCMLAGCGKYFEAYPSESLGECLLDPKGSGPEKERRIVYSTTICNHPEKIQKLEKFAQTPFSCTDNPK